MWNGGGIYGTYVGSALRTECGITCVAPGGWWNWVEFPEFVELIPGFPSSADFLNREVRNDREAEAKKINSLTADRG
jgi:hypothetical protein